LKRAAVAAAAGSDKIQEAVVEKGIEVVGNAIDKQIANIEGAQNKSEAFLNKRVCDCCCFKILYCTYGNINVSCIVTVINMSPVATSYLQG
jgi:hypothetical protein